MEHKRLPRNQYFMELAESAAKRGTCPRAIVGCVLIQSGRPISTGYNSSHPKTPHCCDEGCLIHDNHCLRTTHAEMSAIHRLGYEYGGEEIIAYITHRPCINCYKELATTVTKIYYRNTYLLSEQEEKIFTELVELIGVELIYLPKAD